MNETYNNTLHLTHYTLHTHTHTHHHYKISCNLCENVTFQIERYEFFISLKNVLTCKAYTINPVDLNHISLYISLSYYLKTERISTKIHTKKAK